MQGIHTNITDRHMEIAVNGLGPKSEQFKQWDNKTHRIEMGIVFTGSLCTPQAQLKFHGCIHGLMRLLREMEKTLQSKQTEWYISVGVLRLEVHTHEPPLLGWVSLDAPEPAFCLDYYSASASRVLRHYCEWSYYQVLVETAREGGCEWKTAVKARQNVIFLFCKPKEC